MSTSPELMLAAIGRETRQIRIGTGGVMLPHYSPFKVAEKGRRTGLTWAEASDNVLIAAADKAAGGQNVYYIGQDKDMTEEYIDACAMWAREFNQAAAAVESGLWDDADDEGNSKSILTYTIRFPKSRHRITALASRPKKLCWWATRRRSRTTWTG